MLAGHLAVAIENATLYRETRWYAGLLATLYEIGKETSSILDLDQLLQRVAEVVKRVIDYEMFGILLLDEARGELVLRKAVSYGGANEKKTRIALGEGLSGDGRPAPSSRSSSATCASDPALPGLIPETRSELVVPLVHKDRVVGVFDLESSVLDRFTEEHLEGAHPAGQPGGGGHRERAPVREAGRGRRSASAASWRIAQWVQQNLFPDEPPVGARMGRLRPLPARHRAGRRPLRLLRAGRGRAGPGRGRRGGQGQCRRRSSAPSSPAASARAPSSGGPPATS